MIGFRYGRGVLRVLLTAWVLVLVTSNSAEARRGGGGGIVIINTGDDIVHVRDLGEVKVTGIAPAADLGLGLPIEGLGEEVGLRKLGYRYQRFGLFWFDLWRWDGEFVLYEGDTYLPIDDEMVAQLGGASVPWRYRLPDGFLIVVAGLYLWLIGRRKRKVKTTFIIAAVFAAMSAAFFFMGLTWEFLIPLGLALHHALSARSAMKHAADEPVEDTPAEVPETRVVSAPPTRPSKPPVATGKPAPARPSQPLVIQPTSTPPAAVPVREDKSVDGPTFLR